MRELPRSAPERQLSNTNAYLIVSDGLIGAMLEDEVAQMRVCIEAAKIALAEFHQELTGLASIAGVLEVVRLRD